MVLANHTAEDAVASGEVTHEELRSFSGHHGLAHMVAPCCGAVKPLFAMAKHPAHPWWACDWCRLDADRAAAGDRPPTDEELWVHIASERRSRLNDSLWALADDGTVALEERNAWIAYRQAVAKMTRENLHDPRFVTWPVRPD